MKIVLIILIHCRLLSEDKYKEPSYESEIVTQGLLWDKLTILSKKNNWFEVKQSDITNINKTLETYALRTFV